MQFMLFCSDHFLRPSLFFVFFWPCFLFLSLFAVRLPFPFHRRRRPDQSGEGTETFFFFKISVCCFLSPSIRICALPPSTRALPPHCLDTVASASLAVAAACWPVNAVRGAARLQPAAPSASLRLSDRTPADANIHSPPANIAAAHSSSALTRLLLGQRRPRAA